MTNARLWILGCALALVGLSASAADVDTAGAQKLGWKLTLQTWTDRQQTVVEAIDLAKQIGAGYVEIFPGQQIAPDNKAVKFGPAMTDDQIKQVLDKAKACGVEVIDCGVIGIPEKEADARKFFDWAKKVGLTTIVAEPKPEALPMIDKVAGEYGIKVAIHDHPKPSRYWDPEFTYEHIKDLKNVGYCADVGHWKRSGLDPVEVLKKHGDKVFSLHFKDLVPNDNGKGWHDTIWGTGQSHAAEMLAVLKEKGFKGPVAIEYEHAWDIPTLSKCAEFFYAEANKLATP